MDEPTGERGKKGGEGGGTNLKGNSKDDKSSNPK